MLPASRAAAAQTDIGKSPVKRMSRSIPMPNGKTIEASSPSEKLPSSGIAEIGEAEERIAIRIQLGREPDAFAQRVEELDDGHMVGTAIAAIGEQSLAQVVGQEDHAALLSFAGSPAVSVSGRKASSQSAALLA